MISKKYFLKKIDEKWGEKVTFVSGKQKKNTVFALFPFLRKFYGFAEKKSNKVKKGGEKK